ncbi:MAG: hypothetical protein R3324_09735, partial [Halobacteriales archaeon]|nr:hypothetical protein [Halobacteriales archaeon]
AILALSFLMQACAAELPTDSVADEGLRPQLAKGGKPGVSPGPVEETPLSVTFADRVDDAIRSDGLFGGKYEDGACGVAAHFNSTSDDAILDPDASRIRRKDQDACGTSERAMRFDLGFMTIEGGFMNIDKVRTVETADVRRAQFNIDGCNRLVFDPTEYPGTNYIEVERVDESTWYAHAEAGFAVGHCVDLGSDVDAPFAVVIQLLP